MEKTSVNVRNASAFEGIGTQLGNHRKRKERL